MEHANVIWDPYFKKDITLIENVQRRATKMVRTIRNLSYEERLKELDLITLEQRRQRGRLIETYKILTEYYDVPSLQDLYTLNANKHLRGHSFKLWGNASKKKPLKQFLPNRVVTAWNRLPESVVKAPTLNCFKNRLDRLNISKLYETHASAK